MSVPGPTITLPATLFRDHLFTLLDWVSSDRGQVVVTIDGERVAVLRWEENLWDDPLLKDKRAQLRRKITTLVRRAKKQEGPER